MLISFLILTLSSVCVITNSRCVGTFTTTYTKLSFPVVTLSTQDNLNLLEQLKSGFKRTFNWNEYQSKVSIKAKNPYLNYLVDILFYRLKVMKTK